MKKKTVILEVETNVSNKVISEYLKTTIYTGNVVDKKQIKVVQVSIQEVQPAKEKKK